ncbi:MAG: prevent-host-death protein [Lentisphaerota bacterium]
MVTYTYTEAKKDLKKVLNTAYTKGQVAIKQRNGLIFKVQLEKTNISPFDVEGIKTKVSTKNILEAIQSSRCSKRD